MLPVEQDLRAIERFSRTEARPTLSLYLNARPGREERVAPEALVDGLLGRARRGLPNSGGETDSYDRAASMVVGALKGLDRFPSSFAAFACPDHDFVRVVSLPGAFASTVHWGSGPRLKELLSALEEHECAIVALVDQEHARVYRYFLDQVEEVEELTRRPHDPPLEPSHGERKGERRHEWHVRRHLERVLAAIHRGDAAQTDRLFIGGGRETVHELLHLLPKRVRSRTRLISGLPAGTPQAQVLARIVEIQSQAERESEEELLDNLIERDQAHAVFGFAAVAEAVADARVHTLVFGGDATTSGSECSACGWLMLDAAQPSCPRCGGGMETVPDLVERMISRVAHSGGRVEEVHGPALHTLARRGGLAALLRYSPSASNTLAGSTSRGRHHHA